jgi:hypothetical protein
MNLKTQINYYKEKNMYGHVDGYIIPCQWGIKEKVTGYLLSNEDEEDVIIHCDQMPSNLVKTGNKVRLFGEIIPKKGFKEMNVERFRVLEEIT